MNNQCLAPRPDVDLSLLVASLPKVTISGMDPTGDSRRDLVASPLPIDALEPSQELISVVDTSTEQSQGRRSRLRGPVRVARCALW
jgi:hypothetical protein